MKKNIHPKYYPNTKVTCSCGETFEVGSTSPEIRVELCSACHPFFTGKQKYIDTAGRIDRFKAKLQAKETLTKVAAKKTTKTKKPEEKAEAKPESEKEKKDS